MFSVKNRVTLSMNSREASSTRPKSGSNARLTGSRAVLLTPSGRSSSRAGMSCVSFILVSDRRRSDSLKTAVISYRALHAAAGRFVERRSPISTYAFSMVTPPWGAGSRPGKLDTNAA